MYDKNLKSDFQSFFKYEIYIKQNVNLNLIINNNLNFVRSYTALVLVTEEM